MHGPHRPGHTSMLHWDDLRFLLAIARFGTMSAAARSLGVAQPTVGRRLAAFERRLGARLFLPSKEGWTLTPSGRHLFVHAERMEREALAAEIVARGRDEGLRGRVRLTASEWLVRSVLGPAVATFVARHPELSLELVADPRHLNLARRDADLAIRPSRFDQADVHQREIAVVEFGLYAADAYLERVGFPDFDRAGAGLDLIAMTEDMRSIVDVEWLPPLVGNARVVVRTNGREPMATMAAAGMGLACLPRAIGDATPGLRLLPTPGPRPERKLWLGAHRKARTVPRVRATVDFVVAAFAQMRPRLRPSKPT